MNMNPNHGDLGFFALSHCLILGEDFDERDPKTESIGVSSVKTTVQLMIPNRCTYKVVYTTRNNSMPLSFS